VKTYEKATKFASKQLDGMTPDSYDKPSGCWHYGRMEIMELLDFIFETATPSTMIWRQACKDNQDTINRQISDYERADSGEYWGKSIREQALNELVTDDMIVTVAPLVVPYLGNKND